MTNEELRELIQELCAKDSWDADLHTLIAQKMFNTDTPTSEQRSLAQRRAFMAIYSGPLPSPVTTMVAA